MVDPNGPSESRGLRSLICRYRLLLGFLVLSAYSVFAFAFWVEEYWRPGWDSAIYLLTARSISDGLGYSYLGSAFFLRPPGLSWLLSFFVRDGGFDFHLLNLVVMAFGVATVWVIFFVFRPRYGCWWALAIALLTGTSRLFVSHFNWIMAEFPSFMLLFLGIGLLDQTARVHRWRWTSMVAGSLLLAASAYMRSATLVAAPGIVVVYLLRRGGWGRLRSVIPILILVAIVGPWLHHASKESSKAERPSEQLLVFDYKTAVFHVDPGNPDSEPVSAFMWKTRIENNAAHLIENGTYWILGTRNRWASYAFTVAVLLGFMLSLRRHTSMLDLFALVYAGMLLGYFVFAERLLLLVIPLAYLYILETLRFALAHMGQHFSRRAVPHLAGIIIVLFLLVLNLTTTVGGFHRTGEWSNRGKERQEQRWEDYRLTANWLRLNTAEGTTVLAGPAPTLSILADRTVFTNRFRPTAYILARHNVDFAIFSCWARKWGEGALSSRARSRWVLASTRPGEFIHIYHLSDSGLLPQAPDGESMTESGWAKPSSGQ